MSNRSFRAFMVQCPFADDQSQKRLVIHLPNRCTILNSFQRTVRYIHRHITVSLGRFQQFFHALFIQQVRIIQNTTGDGLVQRVRVFADQELNGIHGIPVQIEVRRILIAERNMHLVQFLASHGDLYHPFQCFSHTFVSFQA